MAKRLDFIKEILAIDRKVEIADLCRRFKVSAVTIRKDIDELYDAGHVIKVRGGAVLARDAAAVVPYDQESSASKEEVAQLALATIDEDDCIFLGSGVTCFYLARLLRAYRNLTVVTNNINAIAELSPCINNVFLLGGEIITNDGMFSTDCAKADELFGTRITIRKAYTSIFGLDCQSGLMVNFASSVKTYDFLPKISRKWHLLVDDSKYDKIGLYSVSPLEAVDVVITNMMPERYQSFFAHKGVTVIAPDSAFPRDP